MLKNFEIKRYEEKAKEQFKKQLNEKIERIAEKCWPCNLNAWLKELNGIIGAGKKMNITTANIFSENELEQLVDIFTPLRVLEMTAEIHNLLCQALSEKGIHHEIFAK